METEPIDYNEQRTNSRQSETGSKFAKSTYVKLNNEGVEIYISGWDWFIHLLNEWDNSVLKHIMSKIMMYDKEQLGKNPLQGSQMPMNERTKKLTISELEKFEKDNLEQLVEKSNISSKVLNTLLTRSCPYRADF